MEYYIKWCKGCPTRQELKLAVEAALMVDADFADCLEFSPDLCDGCSISRINCIFDTLCPDLRFLLLVYLFIKRNGTVPHFRDLVEFSEKNKKDQVELWIEELLIHQKPVY